MEQLKKEVYRANVELARHGLVTLTWGNVSGIDRSSSLVAIKPSGVDYRSMSASDMVVVSTGGKVVEGTLRPSSDTPTHLELYRAFPAIGGVAHTHSLYASMFAQACREIPCLGTTHADHFNGPVPVTRFLTGEEVDAGYEAWTGKIIVERFSECDPAGMPGVLVAGHAPFTWGAGPADAVENSLILERIAQMALGSLQLNPAIAALPMHIQRKHYQRKHGPEAYYGQKNK
ncbi:MAG: L-ribulose-5-phosphate 4-epimerase AraD [Acidobacteria bacterium]|nr:L-ribulose-5-phosphate 4-epimerase AraD [Acidobacteriota bacterium]